VLCAAPALVATPGCAAPHQVDSQTLAYHRAQESFIAIVRGLIAAYDAGAIDQAQWDQTYLPLIEAGDKLLDQAKSATDPDERDGLLSALSGVVAELKREGAAHAGG